jgi:transposase
VDVAKDELVIAHANRLFSLPNQKRRLRAWLKTLPAHCYVALESTGRYHLLLADLAHAAGHQVFVLNPQQVKHYRTATGKRAKTDECDAKLIARYLEKELAHLRRYHPLSPDQQALSRLLRRRACLVKATTQLRLSFQDDAGELKVARSFQNLLKAHQQLLKTLDKKIEEHLAHCEKEQPQVVERLRSIVGVGPLSCAALLVALEKGEFPDADAFVAFLGLDPVARDSGKHQGRRRLSKKGDSEIRRLLFGAALSASQTKVWNPIYQRYLERGLSRIQSLCILARKLARTAWSIYTHGTTFCPERLTQPLT